MKNGNGNGAEKWKPAALSIMYCYYNLRNFKKVLMKFDFTLKVEGLINITNIFFLKCHFYSMNNTTTNPNLYYESN